ncbi:hypothetical protein NP493_1338g00041 [Ridgeia piscesae]|uniref:Uncharacterized protein n=1 Tax=Ridgeia piscesae TaxID=27915 RepID=A0AAD9NEY0_RIDPI|nr:hypothetical protein NP493_1338g00041 [Ridgeia piscesae]
MRTGARTGIFVEHTRIGAFQVTLGDSFATHCRAFVTDEPLFSTPEFRPTDPMTVVAFLEVFTFAMTTNRTPKQWLLTKNETVTSFQRWKDDIIYVLSLDANFASFLCADITWLRKYTNAPTRGLVDDTNDVPTAVQKCVQQELMLGQIANFCPVIPRNATVKHSTSLADVWQKILGFQSTGAHFLDLVNIRHEPERLF